MSLFLDIKLVRKGKKSRENKFSMSFPSYLVRQNVEFSLLLVKVTGRNLSVMFILLAQADSFLA